MMKKVILTLLPILLFAVPNNPSNLLLIPTKDSVTLRWQDNSNDETSFKIYRGGMLIGTTTANQTSYHDKFLAAHTSYHYTVKASDSKIGAWTRTNPGAGGTIAMIGATASGIMITAADVSGIYRSFDKGKHWDVRGDANGIMDTHTSALGFHPTDGDTFYVGTGTGLYKTSDRGEHFTKTTLGIADDYDTYVESITVSKNKPQTLYVTHHTWDNNTPSKISKSENGGTTWSDVSIDSALTTSRLRIVKLLVHPKDDKILYAIAGKPRWGCSPAKAYRTTDGGLSWNLLEDKGAVLDIDIDPNNTHTIYMSTFHAKACQPVYEDDFDMNDYVLSNGAGKLYKSTDRGDSFGSEVFNQTGIISVGKNPNTVKLVNNLTFQHVHWMGAENTGTWQSTQGGIAGSWGHTGSIVSDWDIGYALNPYSAYGYTYNGLNKTITKDIFNPERFYGAGGWTMASFDGGKTFESLSTTKVGTDGWISTGLENINGNSLDVNDNNPNVIYMGGYDIGLWASLDRGLSWKRRYPFKDDLVLLNKYTWGATDNYTNPLSHRSIGGTNVITLLSDPNHANVVWSSFAKAQGFNEAKVYADSSLNDRSGMFRSDDFGATWTLSTIRKNGQPMNTHYHARFYGLSVDKSTPAGSRTLYVTVDGDVAKSTNDGLTWDIIHEDGGLKYTAVAGNVLYAGGKSGLWRFKNNTWTQMGGNFKTEMMGIGSPMREDISPTWDDVDWDNTDANGIPAVTLYAWRGVHDIKVDPIDSNTVYVVAYGEGKGLYKTETGGASWIKIDLGAFENRYLRSMTINPTNTDMLFVSSSENINSGGDGDSSTGIFYSLNGGSTWHDGNDGMAWKYGAKIEIDSTGKRVWAWSPGTGVQYAPLR